MDSKIEQRVIKFLINSGEKPAKIFLKLKKVLYNERVLRAHVLEWARWFKEGRSVYNDKRPSASKDAVLANEGGACFFDTTASDSNGEVLP